MGAIRMINENQKIKRFIQKAKKNNWKIVLYGMGIWGRDYGNKLLGWLDLKADYVSDGDQKKLNQCNICDVEILSKEDLLNIKQKVLVFVCIGQFYIDEVLSDLKRNSNLEIVTLDEVLGLDEVLENFYKISDIRAYEKKKEILDLKEYNLRSEKEYKKGNRIAIYTCIVGGYDNILEPEITEDNCDYYLISDEKPKDLSVFQWIDVTQVVPKEITDYREINRYCKMHAETIFADYRYSIYLDGKIKILRPISKYIDDMKEIGIAIHKHGFMDCIYTEGMRMVGSGICEYGLVREQMLRYLYEGMPRNYGLFECCIIVRDHSNLLGKKIMHEWFEEFCAGQKRDQFSLTYILWKNNLSVQCIGTINEGRPWKYNRDILRMKKHLK